MPDQMTYPRGQRRKVQAHAHRLPPVMPVYASQWLYGSVVYGEGTHIYCSTHRQQTTSITVSAVSLPNMYRRGLYLSEMKKKTAQVRATGTKAASAPPLQKSAEAIRHQ